MEAELASLQERYEAALHMLHRGEMNIRKLEEVIAQSNNVRVLQSEASTSTAHDFGLSEGPGLSPYTQVMHLEAVLAREERLYEEARAEHAAQVTQLTREGLELMALLGDPTAPLGGVDLVEARARVHAAAAAALAEPYPAEQTNGGSQIAQLPADALLDNA
jgi:hypothetical protein